MVNTKMSMVWTASGTPHELPAAKPTREHAERHDGFVHLGIAIQTDELHEDVDSRAVPMGDESFTTDFLQDKLKRARSLSCCFLRRRLFRTSLPRGGRCKDG